MTLRCTRAWLTVNVFDKPGSQSNAEIRRTRNVNNTRYAYLWAVSSAYRRRRVARLVSCAFSFLVERTPLSLFLAFWFVLSPYLVLFASVCSATCSFVDYFVLLRLTSNSRKKKSSPNIIICSNLPQVRRETVSMKRHLSDSEPETIEEYDECSRYQF